MALHETVLKDSKAMGTSVDSFCVILDGLVDDQTIDAGTAGRIKSALMHNHANVEKVVQPTKDGAKYVTAPMLPGRSGAVASSAGHATVAGQPLPSVVTIAQAGTVEQPGVVGRQVFDPHAVGTVGIVGQPSNPAEEALVGKVGTVGQVLPAGAVLTSESAKPKPAAVPTKPTP